MPEHSGGQVRTCVSSAGSLVAQSWSAGTAAEMILNLSTLWLLDSGKVQLSCVHLVHIFCVLRNFGIRVRVDLSLEMVRLTEQFEAFAHNESTAELQKLTHISIEPTGKTWTQFAA